MYSSNQPFDDELPIKSVITHIHIEVVRPDQKP